jgi:hypothetical protein
MPSLRLATTAFSAAALRSHCPISATAGLISSNPRRNSPTEIRALAESILPITRRAGVGLVINDHPTSLGNSPPIFVTPVRRLLHAGYTNVSSPHLHLHPH